MAYRKFVADRLFTGYYMLDQSKALITGEQGTIADIVDLRDAGDGIERYNGILCPGFVNAHCHLELSHMKGVIAPGSGMTKFLLTVMAQRSSSDEEIVSAMQDADVYMRERGIAAVGDICNTALSAQVKRATTLYYHNFIEATGFTGANAAARFEHSRKVYETLMAANILQACSIVPHAPYSVSDELFRLINSFDPYGLISIHNQESEAESEFMSTGKGGFTELYQFLKVDIGHFSGNGKTGLVHALEQFGSGHAVILVHNAHTGAEDLGWIHAHTRSLPSLWWCLCPNANLYIGNSLPDVMLLKNNGCQMVVGTDSLASNHALNILEELKTLQSHFASLATEDLLRWATINGAEALRIGHTYGSFEEGKRPGVVNIDGGLNGTLEGAVAKRVL